MSCCCCCCVRICVCVCVWSELSECLSVWCFSLPVRRLSESFYFLSNCKMTCCRDLDDCSVIAELANARYQQPASRRNAIQVNTLKSKMLKWNFGQVEASLNSRPKLLFT